MEDTSKKRKSPSPTSSSSSSSDEASAWGGVSPTASSCAQELKSVNSDRQVRQKFNFDSEIASIESIGMHFGTNAGQKAITSTIFDIKQGYTLRQPYINTEFLQRFILLYLSLSIPNMDKRMWYVSAVLCAFSSDQIKAVCEGGGDFKIVSDTMQFIQDYKKENWLTNLNIKLLQVNGNEEILRVGDIEVEFLAYQGGYTEQWYRKLDQYFTFAPKHYAIKDFRYDYLNVYTQLCSLWLKSSRLNQRNIEFLISRYQSFFSQLTGYFIRNKGAPKQATDDVNSKVSLMLQQSSSAKPVYFPIMDLISALYCPSHKGQPSQNGIQLSGDGFERVLWVLMAAVSDACLPLLNAEQISAEDEAVATQLLKQEYSDEWFHQQRSISRFFCGPMRLPFAWSLDTFSGEHTFQSCLTATAAVSKAVKHCLGRLANGVRQNAFCIARPPGHHHDSSPQGFCFTNYVAVQALALAREGRKVLIVDCDAHFGDGTQRLLMKAIDTTPELAQRIKFVNIFANSGYPFEVGSVYGQPGCQFVPPARFNGIITNIPCPKRSTAPFEGDRGLHRVFAGIKESGFTPDCTLLSLGFDAHRFDKLAPELVWTTQNYPDLIELMASMWPRPIIAVTEGGYNEDALKLVSAAVIEKLAQSYGAVPQTLQSAEEATSLSVASAPADPFKV